MVGPELGSKHLLKYLPFNVTRQAVGDIVAATIYIVFFGLQIFVWVWWQKRGTKKAGAKELTSSYGRPLVKRS